MIIPTYSNFLSCIYDEAEPHGKIGRGTHYSVFRSPTWLDDKGKPGTAASIHDFAVIWDEDHDDRVVTVAECMYMAGLLFPVLFLGERKGTLTVVLSEYYDRSADNGDRHRYEKHVAEIAANVPTGGDIDYWHVEFGVFEARSRLTKEAERGAYHRSLVQEDTVKTDTYLHNINNLWNLGQKPFRFPKAGISTVTNTTGEQQSSFTSETA